MLIDPAGLLYGERIGACSDLAQLHFPRLMAASNGFGRIEMSYTHLAKTVYASLAVKPTKAELEGWFAEYHRNFLLLPYRTEMGSTWGQWDVPAKMLPRFKTAEDARSPAPPANRYAAYQEAHKAAKQAKYLASQEPLAIPESFGNVPKDSEDCGGFLLGIGIGTGVGIGIGVGEEQKQKHVPSAPSLVGETDPKQSVSKPESYRDEDVEAIWELWPNKGGKRQGLHSIRQALKQRANAGVADPVADLTSRVRTWLAWHAREVAAGRFVAAVGFAQGWFGDKQRRYLDPAAELAPKTQYEDITDDPERAAGFLGDLKAAAHA